jgi:hypothetical protein
LYPAGTEAEKSNFINPLTSVLLQKEDNGETKYHALCIDNVGDKTEKIGVRDPSSQEHRDW